MTHTDLIARLRDKDKPLMQQGGFSSIRLVIREAADALIAAQERIEALEGVNHRMREALTPSGETKYAYIGEFSWTDWVTDANGDEQGYERIVPWVTIKEIMAAILARAALDAPNA